MLIIVEGVDGSGKSTLVNELVQQGAKIVTAVPREWPNMASYCYDLYKSCTSSKFRYVMDRSIITEWIYRFVKKDKETTLEFGDIPTLLNMQGLHVVLCKNSKSYRRAMDRGEDYVVDMNEHKLIENLYDFVAYTLKTMCPNVKVHYYDYEDKHSMCKLLKQLKLE